MSSRVSQRSSDAGEVEPLEDVAPAVAPGHPDVLADRQRHRASRPVHLLGDLQAAGGAADHEHAARRQLVRIAVRGDRDLDDVRGDVRRDRRERRRRRAAVRT